jgi:hypothetical protein
LELFWCLELGIWSFFLHGPTYLKT